MVPWMFEEPAGRTINVSLTVFEEREGFSTVELDEDFLLLVLDVGVFKLAFGAMVVGE